MTSPSSRLLSQSTTRTRHTSSTVSTSPDSSPAPPLRAYLRPSSMFVRPTKEMPDAWSSGGMILEIEDYPKFLEEVRAGYLLLPIDPDDVRFLAGSQSFFVHLGELDAIAVPLMGEESFLSSSPDRFLYPPIPQRERPVSMQTTPHTRETRRERGDCAWMLEESSPELKACELGEEEEEDMRLDVERDWRQFHVDWVRNIR